MARIFRGPLPPPHLMRMALRVAKIRGKAKLQHALVLADAMDEAGWPGDSIPTGRKGPADRYRVIDLDVWGNARDGYEINDRYRTSIEIAVPTEERLHGVRWYREALGRGNLLRASAHSIYSVFDHVPGALKRALRRAVVDLPAGIEIVGSGWEELIEVTTRRGRPLLHLEEIRRA